MIAPLARVWSFVSGVMAAGLALVLAVPAGAAPPPHHAPAPRGAAPLSVVRSDHDSILIGNPRAPVHLIEYISYTCPHCAAFTREGDAPLLDLARRGKIQIEVRSYMRNGVDLAVSMLMRCLPAERFHTAHVTVLAKQVEWFNANLPSDPERQRPWMTGTFNQQMKAMARDLHLYELFGPLGLNAAAIDRCYADEQQGHRIADATKYAYEHDYVTGTPTFVLDGVPLGATVTWGQLQPQIEVRLR